MDVGYRTDKGVRRANNEDACLVMQKSNVFVVADGVGGGNSGEVASRTAVNEVAEYILINPLYELREKEDIRDYFLRCIKDVNHKVFDSSQKEEANHGMATTMVAAYVFRNDLYILNVGDSRAYVYRNKILTQITDDHTYVNTLLKQGIITEKEAENHEQRHMITRAVGAETTIDVDFFKVKLKAGDIILMCTDGLYGEIEKANMEALISKHSSMQELCDDFVEKANANGGRDNITVVCIKIMEEDINE